MIEIKSNAETAQELAASLKDSGDTLSGVAAATKDEKAEEIAAAIESIGTNLQSVSTGFTEVDEATAASMQ